MSLLSRPSRFLPLGVIAFGILTALPSVEHASGTNRSVSFGEREPYRLAQSDEAEMRYRAAAELYDQRQYAEALQILEDARQRFPDDDRFVSLHEKVQSAMAKEAAEEADRLAREERARKKEIAEHLGNGARALDREDFERARAAYQAALSLDPENEEAKVGLGRVNQSEQEVTAAREAEERRENLVRTAKEMASERDYQGAIKLLQEAQTLAPDDREVAKYLERYQEEFAEAQIDQHFARADSLRREARYEEALTELQAALALDPGNRGVERRIARVEREIEEAEEEQEAARRKAEQEAAEEAARLAEERRRETIRAAEKLAREKDYAGAIALLENAQAEFPDDAELADDLERYREDQMEASVEQRIARAESLAKGGRNEEALAELQAALELDPENRGVTRRIDTLEREIAELEAEVREKEREEKRQESQQEIERLLARAETLIDRGDYGGARKELAKVRELQPNNQLAERLEQEARLQEQQKLERTEEEARERRLEEKRTEARNLVQAARVALRDNRYDEAMRLAGEATKLDAQNQDAVAVAQEAAAKKVEIARNAEVERVENDIDRRLTEARTYLGRNDYDAAIEVCKQVLLIDDGNEEAIKLREEAEAAKQEDVEQVRQQEARGHYDRAQVFFSQGQWGAAEDELRQALEFDPDHRDSQRLLDKVVEAREREAREASQEQERKEEEQRKVRAATAQEAFEEGQMLYERGDVIGAWEAWEQAVQIDPSFETPRVFMERTEADYQKALAIQEEDERIKAEDAKWEAKLDEVIASFEITKPTEIETVLTNILGVLSGFNFIVSEGVTGEVELRITRKTLREILDLLLVPYGFTWTREKDTILVRTKFRTRVFPLTPEEYKRVKQILEHPESLENPELDLRRIIYGERDPEVIPGRQLRLNEKTQTLIVRDSDANIAKVEAWLAQLEDIVIAREPYIYRSWVLDPEIARTVYELVVRFLVEERAGDEVTHRQEGKRIIFDETSGTLVILDTPQNIQHVEEIILREDILAKLKRGVLKARVFRITDDTGMDPESVFRRLEVIRGVVQILRTMLYEGTGETEEEANARGRRIFFPESRDQELRDPRFIGTITVVDTEENLKKVQDFLGSAGGTGTRNFYVIDVKHRDIRDLKRQLDRATGLRREQDEYDTGYGGIDIRRQLQVRALIVEDPSTSKLIIRAEDPTIMDEIETVVELLDEPTDQVEIESRLISVSLDEIRSVGLDWTFGDIGRKGINWSYADGAKSGLNLISDPSTTVGATFQTIGPTTLSVVLNLISTLDTAEVLSAPKITVVSSPPDPALMQVTTREPVVSEVSLDTKGDDDPRNDTYRPTFDQEDVGITLEVNPTVLPDGYVLMDIIPEVSTVVGRVPIVVTGEEAGSVGGMSLEALGPLILDESRAETRLRVKDGDTVVIGGLVRDQLARSVNSVPILGNLPLLGPIFRDEGTTVTKDTLLMFVTVHIIKAEI